MYISQITQDDDIHHLYKEGFANLRAGFDEFLTENNLTFDDEFGYFKIYSNVVIDFMIFIIDNKQVI